MSVKINGKTVSTIITQSPDSDGIGIGAYHLSDTPELYEPQRSNNFMFEIGLNSFPGYTNTINNNNKLQRVGSSYYIDGKTTYFDDPEKVIQLAVKKVSVPSYSQKALTVNRGNTTIRYAGKIEFSDSTSLELVDYIGAEVKDILLAWQALSGNPYTERVGHASDYKKDAYLCEYTPDYLLVRRTKLVGCWVSDLTFGDFNNDNNEIMSVSAKITYDRAYTNFSSMGGTITGNL